jgi:uncharacterized surface protein with fasciclin (FAS1) repeats
MKKIVFSLFMLLLIVSCTDPNEGSLFVQPSKDLNTKSMTDLLEEAPETYSMWLEMLHHANYYNALKDANATATVFCPTNDAVKAFLVKRGVNTIEELPYEYARKVVQNHIVNQELVLDSALISLASVGAALPAQNLFKKDMNLTFGYNDVNVDDTLRTSLKFNTDTIYFNNQARLDRVIGLQCGNGKIFRMADVIVPNADNVYEKLLTEKGDGNTYVIFAAAIKADADVYKMATTDRDTVIIQGGQSQINYYSYTVYATPDNVMQAAGINDVASLKDYLVRTSNGEETNGEVALNHYLNYHFMPAQHTITDVYDFSTAASDTLIYDTKYTGQAIICYYLNGKKKLNTGIDIVRSDVKASNGYIHKISDVMPVFHPTQVPINWDFFSYPDLISLITAYGNANGKTNLYYNDLEASEYKAKISAVTSQKYGKMESLTFLANENSGSSSFSEITYVKEAQKKKAGRPLKNPDGTYQARYGSLNRDYMGLKLGFAGWMECTTPIIIAGKYDVILHYVKSSDIPLALLSAGTQVQFNMDATTMTRKYLYRNMASTADGSFTETLWNGLEFSGSAAHTFRLTTRDMQAKSMTGYLLCVDYIEFKPVK